MSTYLDTITATAQRLAGEAYDAFEIGRRGPDAVEYVKLTDDAPTWVREAVYQAHDAGGMMPDDWRYEKTRDAFGAIHEAPDDADASDVGHEFADGAVDVYTADRLAWLASNLNRPAYCDDAIAEFGEPSGLGSDGGGILDRIGAGQYMEAREIWDAVLSAVAEQCEEGDDLDDEADGYTQVI